MITFLFVVSGYVFVFVVSGFVAMVSSYLIKGVRGNLLVVVSGF